MVDPVGGGGDVKVPGVGDVPKKYVVGGVIVGSLIAIVVYIRIRNTAASTAATTAAPATDTSAIDPATGIPYSEEQGDTGIDPATGIPYIDESGGGSYGASDVSNLDASGYPIGSAQDLAYQAQQSSGISSNEEWVQAAMGDLPGDQATIQAALLGVLSGQTVTNAQKTLFLEAVALNGNPPQGYPTPIKLSDTAAQPGTPAPTAKVTIPKSIIGQPQEAAFAILGAAGLKPVGTKLVPGKTLIVQSSSPAAGSSVAKGSTVTLHSAVPKAK